MHQSKAIQTAQIHTVRPLARKREIDGSGSGGMPNWFQKHPTTDSRNSAGTLCSSLHFDGRILNIETTYTAGQTNNHACNVKQTSRSLI